MYILVGDFVDSLFFVTKHMHALFVWTNTVLNVQLKIK